MGLFNKSIQVLDGWLDSKLVKAKATNSEQPPAYERKALTEIEYGTEQQWGWKEKRGLVGPGVLKNMARKDAIIAAVIMTRINQVSEFAQPQKDQYSPGFKIKPKEPADLSREDKMSLGNPELSEEEYEQLNYELEQKKSKLQAKQDKDIADIQKFILHCGVSEDETDTTFVRCDFDRCLKLWILDRLMYNYTAAELVPTKDRSRLHHWYPVSAGTIRYVSRASAQQYEKTIKEALKFKFSRMMKDGDNKDLPVEAYQDKYKDKPYRYVQVVRGRVEAAWTEDEFLFEAGIPTIDPEDNGYAMGELEMLLQIVTAHLFAEAHNRNYFTQGVGTKGILHIKGENLSRGQLEGFKRQWFNQLASARNSFRPPIIGLADEVKWIELAQSNKEMEFENWMNYLIRVICGVFQIDPAEINFDITKGSGTQTTLNEGNNEQRLKSSRDKGLKPLLNHVQNLINRQILPMWSKDLASKYEFEFVGLDAESREQEMKRLESETKVWKTVNEARTEKGKAPIENGDVILNATYTQFLSQKQQAKMQEEGAVPGMEGDGGDMPPPPDGPEQEAQDGEDLEGALNDIEAQVKGEVQGENDKADKEAADKKKAQEKKAAKKSLTVEYELEDDE